VHGTVAVYNIAWRNDLMRRLFY